MGDSIFGTSAARDRLTIAGLLSPAYLWLTVAVFLPLSAMLYFSFLSDVPFGGAEWHFTTENYRAFLETNIYAILLWKSVRLGLTVTFFCVLIGFPCAYVLAKTIRGRAREALFLLVILPFWSNSLVRIFSWAIVLRGNGVLEIGLKRGPAIRGRREPDVLDAGRRHRPRALLPALRHPYVVSCAPGDR